LGEIDLITTQLLLAGGKYLIEEEYTGDDPVQWYINTLKEQSIFVVSSKQQKIKGNKYIWLEIDPLKTPISEFTIWTDVPDNDTETLAWRKIMYTCDTKTRKECLGLSVVAREINMVESKKESIHLNTILNAIFLPDPKEM
jgi:hypothetical protein